MATVKLEDYFKMGKRKILKAPKPNTGLNEDGEAALMLGLNQIEYKPAPEAEDLAAQVQAINNPTDKAQTDEIPVKKPKLVERALEEDELAERVKQIREARMASEEKQ